MSLSRRLSLAFALLLLACFGATAWFQAMSSTQHEQVVTQRLSSGLAAHIASHSALMAPGGLNDAAVHDLFGKLMDVNPSVEVYVLGLDGRILAQAAPAGHVRRERVDTRPIARLLVGDPLPIFGDDPRSDSVQKVFNAAPLVVDGRSAGYVYVVLLGENRDTLAQHLAGSSAWRTTLWGMVLVAALGLLAGLLAFDWITRPLRELTVDVARFEADAARSIERAALRGPDEIASLRLTFEQMKRRIAEQWRELSAQDQQRRELVANISHDLRTPLTSLHGYLETLQLKAATLSDDERRRYLDVALGQSRKVGRLAQELFELARLEYGVVKPVNERFSLADLVQDVFQKFELAAEARRQRLVADIAPGLPVVLADFGMIERVMTNLLDNAIRHTPEGGVIEVQLRREGSDIQVVVSDSGPGIPEDLQKGLFVRPSFQAAAREHIGGLGLLIVHRILQLHGSDIRLERRADRGTVFSFALNAVAA